MIEQLMFCIVIFIFLQISNFYYFHFIHLIHFHYIFENHQSNTYFITFSLFVISHYIIFDFYITFTIVFTLNSQCCNCFRLSYAFPIIPFFIFYISISKNQETTLYLILKLRKHVFTLNSLLKINTIFQALLFY